jgi:predicted ABC-type ATPase
MIAHGYHVHVFYLWLPSPDMAVLRVRRRVESGGHDVPESVIRRRFWRGLVNFDRVYRPLAATWRVYDASVLDDRPVIAHGAAGHEPTVVRQEIWLQIRKRLEELA